MTAEPDPFAPRGRIPFVFAAGVITVMMGAGYLAVRLTVPLLHNRYLPWIAGRTLGLAAYFALVAMVVVGLWMRHPWRARWSALHPEAMLRIHAALGASVIVLLVGHVTALALDRYAGVGWKGVFVPDAAVYRPWPVTAGVLAAYGLVLVAATAGIGGRVVGRTWRHVHYLSLPLFAAVWVHGLLAGSDGPRLRIVYAATGALVLVLGASRLLAAPIVRRIPTSVAPPVPAAPVAPVAPAGPGTTPRPHHVPAPGTPLVAPRVLRLPDPVPAPGAGLRRDGVARLGGLRDLPERHG